MNAGSLATGTSTCSGQDPPGNIKYCHLQGLPQTEVEGEDFRGKQTSTDFSLVCTSDNVGALCLLNFYPKLNVLILVENQK